MSLQAIREARHGGLKPGIVFVVIGEHATSLDEVRHVAVRSSDDPRLMDWRPLVGLTVAIFTMQPLAHLTLAVLEALQAQRCKVFGAADATGVHPCLEGADEKHEQLLQRTWDLLCPS